jgi:hypothetical protein
MICTATSGQIVVKENIDCSMRTLIRRFAVPLAAALLLSFAAFVLFAWLGELLLGQEAERLFPFSNAHLLEEALEGLYAPLADPLFVAFSLLVAICGFVPSMFWGGLRAAKSEVWLVWLAAHVATTLLALTLRPQLSLDTSPSISHAAWFLLAACLAASGAGIWFSRFRGTTRNWQS